MLAGAAGRGTDLHHSPVLILDEDFAHVSLAQLLQVRELVFCFNPRRGFCAC